MNSFSICLNVLLIKLSEIKVNVKVKGIKNLNKSQKKKIEKNPQQKTAKTESGSHACMVYFNHFIVLTRILLVFFSSSSLSWLFCTLSAQQQMLSSNTQIST